MFKKLFIVILTFVIIICGVSCSAGKANIDDVKKSDTINTNSTLSTSKTIVVVSDETTELTSASEITTAESHSEPTTEVKSTTTRKHITTTKKAVQSTTQDAEVVSSDGKNLGKFKITVYTPGSDGGTWGYQTATGVRSQHLRTCAVDPKVIPLGSTIHINGLTLLACDTGSAVKGNVIDIFYDGSDGEACKWVSNFGIYHNVQKI